jgi:hypothetical protein
MKNLKDLIKNNDKEGIISFMKEHNLTIKDSKIVAATDDAKARMKQQRDFYDQRQLIKKILLNS